MRALFTIVIVLSIGHLHSQPCAGIRRTLVPAPWGLYANGYSFTYNPGDTLVISNANDWTAKGAELESFHGTPSCPLVIINQGDVSMGAIKLNHCTYIKLTGSGTATQYGIFLSSTDGAGVGIEITGRSKVIEVERLSIYHKAYIAWVKQEAACPDSLRYPNWYTDSIFFHDVKGFNIGQDGLYFGSTAPTGGRTINCDGSDISTIIPLRLRNIRIYNCYVDSCNRTGIQLSGADQGDNRIYNNIVIRCGYELNQTQGDGIALGGMTRAWVHDNRITQTFKHGIDCIGSGFSKVENNYIDSSGMLGAIVNSFQPTNIFVDNRPTAPYVDSNRIEIKNNTVGKNAVADHKQIILFNSNGLFSVGNYICGNVSLLGGSADIYVTPGINWTSNCARGIGIKRFGRIRFVKP